MDIPLLDLRREYLSLKEELGEAIEQVLAEMQLYQGPNTRALEQEFADYCGVSFAVSVGSGTDALYLALLSLGIGPGDEVITVSHTFIATVATIAFTGAVPVFVDVNPRSYTMDPAQIEAKITSRTKAIVPVHLYGHPAEMDWIMEIARSRGLKVIEDACQAHGAEYGGRRVGQIGDIGCFSFVYTKLVNAYGDAGMLTTDDEELASRLRLLRDHGRVDRGLHSTLGLNCRMDELHAATVRVKLRRIEQRIADRQAVAQRYNEGLSGTSVGCPWQADDVRHVYWQYVIRSQRRNELAAWLTGKGIGNAVYYPVPCHLQPACEHLGYGIGSLPTTEACSRELLALPIYPELDSMQIEFIVSAIIAFDMRSGTV